MGRMIYLSSYDIIHTEVVYRLAIHTYVDATIDCLNEDRHVIEFIDAFSTAVDFKIGNVCYV